MFVSAKKDKKNNYRFYLSDRARVNGKVKCSDKFIITLHKDILLETDHKSLVSKIKATCIDKGISLDNLDMIMDKIHNVVTSCSDTTNKASSKSLHVDSIDIIEAEIVEEHIPSYETTIMIDAQQYYNNNVKSMLKFNKLSNAFGASPKEEWQIREEELKGIHEKVDSITKSIDDIVNENIKVRVLNNELKELGSTMQLIQDIYINSDNFNVYSKVWLVGGGYINSISFEYGDSIVLPGTGSTLFNDYWQDMKLEHGFDDAKAYWIREDGNRFEFNELYLFAKTTLNIDINDIEGSLIRLMLSGNYEVSSSSADDFDIKIGHNTLYIPINSFIDFINGKPSSNHKVAMYELLKYKNQLYKLKKVKA